MTSSGSSRRSKLKNVDVKSRNINKNDWKTKTALSRQGSSHRNEALVSMGVGAQNACTASAVSSRCPTASPRRSTRLSPRRQGTNHGETLVERADARDRAARECINTAENSSRKDESGAESEIGVGSTEKSVQELRAECKDENEIQCVGSDGQLPDVETSAGLKTETQNNNSSCQGANDQMSEFVSIDYATVVMVVWGGGGGGGGFALFYFSRE